MASKRETEMRVYVLVVALIPAGPWLPICQQRLLRPEPGRSASVKECPSQEGGERGEEGAGGAGQKLTNDPNPQPWSVLIWPPTFRSLREHRRRASAYPNRNYYDAGRPADLWEYPRIFIYIYRYIFNKQDQDAVYYLLLYTRIPPTDAVFDHYYNRLLIAVPFVYINLLSVKFSGKPTVKCTWKTSRSRAGDNIRLYQLLLDGRILCRYIR